MKKAGYILLLLGFGIELVVGISLIMLLTESQVGGGLEDSLIMSAIITLGIIVLEGIAVFQSKRAKSWLIFLIVISVIGATLNIIDGKIPIAPVFFIIGSVLMIKDFKSNF